MSKELSFEVFKELVPKRYKKLVTEEVVGTVNRLINDPDYGEEFKSSMLSHANILDNNANWSIDMYVKAIQFYSLTSSGISLTDSYIRTYPDRLQNRIDRGEGREDIGGEASRYNSSELVNKIREQALVPLHLVNQPLLQQAINVQANLMLGARSEMVRQKASETLIRELRPPETNKIELQMGLSDETRELHDRQNNQLLEIANNQRKLFEQGIPLDKLQNLHIDVVEAEIDE